MKTIQETDISIDVGKLDAIRERVYRSLDSNVEDRNRISARELWLYCVGPDKPINWIKSYKTLLKYVSEKHVSIFNPIIDGSGSGTRYYIDTENIVEFLYRFETNQLS